MLCDTVSGIAIFDTTAIPEMHYVVKNLQRVSDSSNHYKKAKDMVQVQFSGLQVTTLSLIIRVYIHEPLLAPKSAKSREITRKFEVIAGHPRSSIYKSNESGCATAY